MAKLNNYNGSTKIASGLTPFGTGDYPLMQACDIMVAEDGKRLDTKIREMEQAIVNGGGSSGGTGGPIVQVLTELPAIENASSSYIYAIKNEKNTYDKYIFINEIGNPHYELVGSSIELIKFSNKKDAIVQTVQQDEHTLDLVGGEALNNYAYAPSSSAFGYGCKAGILGYYWTYIDFENKCIYLDTVFPGPTTPAEGVYKSDFSHPYVVGDIFSIVNGSKYIDCGTIESIDGNKIYFTEDTLPFASLSNGDDVDDYAFFVVSKFNEGVVPFGYYANAIGEETIALERAAHAEGRQTKAIGQYSHAEGRANESIGYCSHTEGQTNKATGQRAHAEGGGNIATGDNCHVEGKDNVVSGLNSHGEGYKNEVTAAKAHGEGGYNKAYGESCHVEGSSNIASGFASHAQGQYTQATGIASDAGGKGTKAEYEAQTVRGKYNAQSPNALFIIGCGTSDADRRNAFEVHANGHVFVYQTPEWDNDVVNRKYLHNRIESTLNTTAYNRRWLRKKWLAMGDDTTWHWGKTLAGGTNTTYHAAETEHYFNIIYANTQLIATQNGVTNTGFLGGVSTNISDDTAYNNSNLRTGCFIDRIRRMNNAEGTAIQLSTYDVITIFGGALKDCTLLSTGEVSIGDPSDDIYTIEPTNSQTLCGRINTTINAILLKNPTIQIALVTPIPRDMDEETKAIWDSYVDAIIEVCHVRGIPCLDLYHNSALQPNFEKSILQTKNMYSSDDAETDYIHLNANGHALIAPRFKAMLDTLLM